MKLIWSITLTIGILIQPTSSRADYVMQGIGLVSCGILAEGYPQNPRVIDGAMMDWAQGFMSGANASLTNGQYRDLAALSLDAQKASLRNYCDEHPMAEFGKAVLDLYGKLPLKQDTPPSR